MKKILMTLAALSMAAIVHAGAPAKFVQPATQAMGAWYVGAYGGASFYQGDLIPGAVGDVARMIDRRVSFSEKHKLGWDAGFKVGYDFDTTAWMRPVLEADIQLGHFNRKLQAGYSGTEVGNVKASLFSFSTMVNALAKFDCGAWQPYAGVGFGYYNLRTKATLNIPGDQSDFSASETTRRGGFAWQMIAGTDYKFDANWALFAEYKWLNYELSSKAKNYSDVLFQKGRLGQQIVNLGVRYTF